MHVLNRILGLSAAPICTRGFNFIQMTLGIYFTKMKSTQPLRLLGDNNYNTALTPVQTNYQQGFREGNIGLRHSRSLIPPSVTPDPFPGLVLLP